MIVAQDEFRRQLLDRKRSYGLNPLGRPIIRIASANSNHGIDLYSTHERPVPGTNQRFDESSRVHRVGRDIQMSLTSWTGERNRPYPVWSRQSCRPCREIRFCRTHWRCGESPIFSPPGGPKLAGELGSAVDVDGTHRVIFRISRAFIAAENVIRAM
jgi:hypothetical protein